MIKKSLLFCGLLVTLFTSCENPAIFGNEETEDPQGNLKVSIHQIEQTPFSALTRAEAGIACTRLNFVVYDEFGVRVDQENQQSTDANFGTASFQLPEGDYQMVVLGHSSNGNPTLTNAKKITFSNKIGFSDTFLYSKKITVTDEPENLEVELKRIVSLCRFVITDDYPEDIARIRFYYTGGSGAFDATTGFGSVASKQSVEFDVDSDQKQFDLYTFLHDTEGTVHLTVTALNSSGDVIVDHDFDVPMKQNQITWMSGPFFVGGGAGSTGVTITINTDWAGESHVTF